MWSPQREWVSRRAAEFWAFLRSSENIYSCGSQVWMQWGMDQTSSSREGQGWAEKGRVCDVIWIVFAWEMPFFPPDLFFTIYQEPATNVTAGMVSAKKGSPCIKRNVNWQAFLNLICCYSCSVILVVFCGIFGDIFTRKWPGETKGEWNARLVKFWEGLLWHQALDEGE